MRRSLRPFAKWLSAPVLGPLDRRFAEFAEQQRKELERIDERLEIDMRIVDEHLLAIQRASRRVERAISPVDVAISAEVASLIAAGRPALFVVATPGEQLRVPDGYTVQRQLVFRVDDDGCWAPSAADDDISTLRAIRIQQQS